MKITMFVFCVLNSIAEIYTLFKKNISELDSSEDLKWWSLHHGVDMPMAWPTFEVSVVVHVVDNDQASIDGNEQL